MKGLGVGITGLGVINAAGKDREEFVETLFEKKTEEGLFAAYEHPSLNLDVLVGYASHESDFSEDEAATVTGKLCAIAAREAWLQGEKAGAVRPTGLIIGTSTGGQYESERALASIMAGEDPNFSMTATGSISSVSRFVANQLNFEGEVATLSTACTSSANAIALGAAWIRQGRHKSVLVGGGDALCATTVASFYNLGLTGPRPSRPFGSNRTGMTIGEGAAFLLLESLEEIERQGRRPLAELIGIGLSSDAYHMTAPDPKGKGAIAAMKAALEEASLLPSDITYLNAHGTGTRLNDATEAIAIQTLFGERTPVSSIKGLIGHTLAASGAIEAVLAVETILQRKAPPNFGTQERGEDCPIELILEEPLELPEKPVVMSNSFAFGGNNCVLIFAPPADDSER